MNDPHNGGRCILLQHQRQEESETNGCITQSSMTYNDVLHYLVFRQVLFLLVVRTLSTKRRSSLSLYQMTLSETSSEMFILISDRTSDYARIERQGYFFS